MRVVTSEQGRLRIAQPTAEWFGQTGAFFGDCAFAGPCLESGCVHELLANRLPRTVAAWITRQSILVGPVVWCEPKNRLYPPALAAAGVLPGSVYLLRPKSDAEAHWAMVEALRCRGVKAVVAGVTRLTTVEARRLQLAAEHGGGLGLLMRQPDVAVHAARTRWLVSPERGDRLTQRWRLRMIHGHGRPTDQDLLVEASRETHLVRATDILADRPDQATPTVAAG